MRLLFNAGALHGARPGHWTGRDIAFFSGCRVATVLYCTFSRSIGVAAERRVADAETTELERAAEQPAPPVGVKPGNATSARCLGAHWRRTVPMLVRPDVLSDIAATGGEAARMQL